MIKMFNLNEKGIVKRKEMKINQKNKIFGLNHESGNIKIVNGRQQTKEFSKFDVLFGEVLLKKPITNVQCEHNLNVNYLKRLNIKDPRKLMKAF